MKTKLQPDALYLGDNGRCFCGRHAGASASMTGRDISGQRVHRVTEADIAYAKTQLGHVMQCETCQHAKAR